VFGFAAAVLVFFFARLAIPAWIRDDCDHFHWAHGHNVLSTAEGPSLDVNYLVNCFVQAQTRQLTVAGKCFMANFANFGAINVRLIFLWNALCVAATCLVAFFLFEKILKNSVHALIGTLVLVCSTSFMQSAYIVFNPQCLVVLFTSGAMLSYVRWKEAKGKSEIPPLVGMFLCIVNGWLHPRVCWCLGGGHCV
jgi:hypothetical protein